MSCGIPPVIEIGTYDGDYEAYERKIYSLFEEKYISSKMSFQGKMVYQKRHPEYKGKSATFWHITSEGEKEDDRRPDLRRYERITWPAFFIEQCSINCKNLYVWENKRKSQKRTLLLCNDLDYLVVLSNRADYYVLWTAYPVGKNHKKKLVREYEKARAAQ